MDVRSTSDLLRGVRGWQWVAVGMLVYAVVVLALATPSEPVRGLRLLGVPTDEPTFGDLDNILAAIECDRRGLDVLVDNPCDPRRRPMNYPRIWLALGRLGADRGWRVALGMTFLAAYAACVLWLSRKTRARHAPWALGLVLSPAVVLLVERGNNDVVVFCCLAVSAAVLADSRLPIRGLGYALIVLAGLLKLYPIVAGIVVLRERRRHAAWIGGSMIAVFVVYCLAIREALGKIGEVVPRESYWSYGFGVLPRQLALQLGRHGIAVAEDALRVAAYAIVAALLLLSLGWARRAARRPGTPPAETDAETRIAFAMGAAIYVSTFMIGFNWSYRLVFLLLCYPLIGHWRRHAGTRGLALLFFLSSLAVAWLGFFVPVVHVTSLSVQVFPHLDSVFGWILLACCVSGLALLRGELWGVGSRI